MEALAIRYGVSHMPVREALRELQGEGLVVIEPNRGARIRTIDASFVESLFEIRTALEVMMVRRAAARCTERDIAELQNIEALLEQHIAQGDHASLVTQNHRFHQAINRCANNLDALPIIDRHWILLAALWRNYGYGANRFAGVASDHGHLIRALAAHDAEGRCADHGRSRHQASSTCWSGSRHRRPALRPRKRRRMKSRLFAA
ncbi:MAG: GntR family transcriptional regulator [Betaproteobacteria bacterium]|nr:GntR family transcriptional regulator [Betaproteobacteria bacterium]